MSFRRIHEIIAPKKATQPFKLCYQRSKFKALQSNLKNPLVFQAPWNSLRVFRLSKKKKNNFLFFSSIPSPCGPIAIISSKFLALYQDLLDQPKPMKK